MTSSQICKVLKSAGIENYRIETEILLENFFGKYSENMEYDDEKLHEILDRRIGGYPLQYIIGKWWFWNCEFDVDENCLIPRPDTETIVDKAVHVLPTGAIFADLCTGSGCIAVSILNSRNDTQADAYDLFEATVALAAHNAEKNNVSERMRVYVGDVLKPDLLKDNKYDAIISNPPYIKRDVIKTLDREVLHEPLAALDGGEDGLMFYRAIIDNFRENLLPGGFFLFEIGFDQGEDIKNIAKEYGMSCTVINDLTGNCRAAMIN